MSTIVVIDLYEQGLKSKHWKSFGTAILTVVVVVQPLLSAYGAVPWSRYAQVTDENLGVLAKTRVCGA